MSDPIEYNTPIEEHMTAVCILLFVAYFYWYLDPFMSRFMFSDMLLFAVFVRYLKGTGTKFRVENE